MRHVSKRTGRRSARWFIGDASAKGSTQKTWQNGTSSWDPTSQARAGNIWDQGQAAAKAGYGAKATEAQGTFSGYQKAGNAGVAALSGDPAAQKQFMDPYQQGVIDENNKAWQKTNQQGLNMVGDQATASGAFGGGRHGVAEGVMLSNNAAEQAKQTAGLLDTGFNNASARENQVANLGFGGAQQNSDVLSPEAYALQQKKNAFLGPQGQTTSGSQTSVGAEMSGNAYF
jgi:hypothetical protein